jgi:hypothetical protein
MTNWRKIDHNHTVQQDAKIDRLAARKAAADAAFIAMVEAAGRLGFIISRDQPGTIYRECVHCNAYAEFSNLERLDLTPCRCGEALSPAPVPFCGELNADDAIDTAPGCYGL